MGCAESGDKEMRRHKVGSLINKEIKIRNLFSRCDYLFVVDSEVQLDNAHSLKLFIEQNRPVLAPMLIRPYSAWSNYWGLLSSDGYYARSFDYMDIVRNDRRGLWNAPYISSCYLVAGSLIRDKAGLYEL